MTDTAVYSANERAGEVCGFRPTDVISINQPCEIGYHCPVCVYPQMDEAGEEWDERLHWSEYNTFIWCEECDKDYPSVLCMPDLDNATSIYLDIIERHKPT